MKNYMQPINYETLMRESDGDDAYQCPLVETPSINGTSQTTLRTKLFSDRIVMLTGTVNDSMAEGFIQQVKYLAKTKAPVTIYLNSPGGAVSAGLSIYTTIRDMVAKGIEVNIVNTSLAASMGAIILSAAEKGHRFMLPYSKTMIHEPLIQEGVGGSATSIKNTADSILATKATLAAILAERTGKTVEEINEAISFDNFMNAEASIEFGIADSIGSVI